MDNRQNRQGLLVSPRLVQKGEIRTPGLKRSSRLDLQKC
uniref:Solute carrier family 2 member 14 n=2 Tax=Hominidae TaxID=9604 RepID=F5GXT4_HUMAN